MNNKTNILVHTGLFIALGVVLPQFFHLMGQGSRFLPMHIPIILGSLLLGPEAGLIMGLLTPLLSSILTGMPPLMPPIAPFMAVELSLMGWLGGFLNQKNPRFMFWNLLLTIAGGRMIYALLTLIFASVIIHNGQAPLWYIAYSLWSCIPGILLQIILIPVLYRILNQVFYARRSHEQPLP